MEEAREAQDALISFWSKIFVVLWESPKSDTSSTRTDHVMQTVEATTLAGHLGVREMKLHFPGVRIDALKMSDSDRNQLGKDWEREELLESWRPDGGGQGKTEGLTEVEDEQGKTMDVASSCLELRRIWSDTSTLGKTRLTSV